MLLRIIIVYWLARAALLQTALQELFSVLMHLQVGLASGILQAGEAHFQRKLGMPRGMKNSLCQAG